MEAAERYFDNDDFCFDLLPVWERQALRAWSLVQTQLRVGGVGGVIGLDYQGAAAALRLYGLWHHEVVDGLRLIEAVFLRHQRERADESAESRRCLHRS
jgi:hypothetical protein